MGDTLDTLARAAVDGTGAHAGCVLSVLDDSLTVVAVAGEATARLVGATVPTSGTSAGFVVSSGQPMAIAVGPGARSSVSLGVLLGSQPSSVLSVPCSYEDDVVGALELVDKAGGAMFTIDDIELATLLASIAGAALVELGGRPPALPDPAQLGGELARLADTDAGRYAAVAGLLSVLLDRG